MTTTAAAGGPLQQQITQKLAAAFNPVHLDVINESSGHNVPAGSESHFKVVVVSDRFDGVALLQRHRLVNAALSAELDEALARAAAGKGDRRRPPHRGPRRKGGRPAKA